MSSSPTSSRPASSGQINAFEAILRMCAAAAPRPWYPRLYAQSVGMAPEQLYYYLEHLWLDGLVEKAEGAPETGPGLTLTPAGRDVLDDPEALQRLREGRAVQPGSQGGVVREAIRRRARPTVTLGLIAANAAAFLYTLYLASRMGILRDFIGLSPFGGGNPAVTDVIIEAGGVYGAGWLNGEWWRLFTSCFIHIGALHILGNMFALYRVGGEVERWWGPVRYLIIYLCAGLGGSCVALALAPQAVMAGASGALCGVLGAAAVWVLCNGHLLPRSLARQIRQNLLINGVLIVFISLMPGVSWEGHFGGAATGAFVALVMQAQRFGPSPWRWAALAALVPLPWLGYAFIQHERAVNPAWAGLDAQGAANQKEEKEFETTYIKRIHDETAAALAVYENEGGLLDHAPGERKPAQVDQVKKDMSDQFESVKQLADDLAKAGPYADKTTEHARQTAVDFVEALRDLLATARRRLSAGEEWTAEDEAKGKEMYNLRGAWKKLLK